MAVPKKRTGHSAQGHRRSKWKAVKPELTRCPNCGATVLTHTICTQCGTYKGKPVSLKDRKEEIVKPVKAVKEITAAEEVKTAEKAEEVKPVKKTAKKAAKPKETKSAKPEKTKTKETKPKKAKTEKNRTDVEKKSEEK